MDTCPQEAFMANYNSGIERANLGSEGQPEDIEALNETIENSQQLIIEKRCVKCGAMIVDLSTGKFYCGLNAPAEVLESNRRIRQN